MRGRPLLTLLLAAAPTAAAAFTWAPRADVIGEQFGIGLHAGGVIGKKIHLAGGGFIGTSLWGSFRSARVYDPVADSWAPLTAMSSLRTAPGSAVASYLGSPRLYVIGGMDLTDFPISHFTHADIEEYDPVAMTWRVVGSGMPDGTATWGTCAVVVDNQIYIMGGVDDTFTGMSARLARYDPDSDGYATLAAMPEGVSDGACAVVGRTIYWVGGYDNNNGWGALPQALTFAYDIDSDTWSTLAAAIPTPRANAAAIAIGSTIYVVGGWDGSGTYLGLYNTTDSYDTVGGTWTGDVPGPLGCAPDDGSQFRGRCGFTLHETDDAVGPQVFAVGGNIGISLPTRCNEAAPRPSTVIDLDPPVFSGLGGVVESRTCSSPPTPRVVLDWPLGTDATPPVVYDVYRGQTPTFTPDATTLIASGVAGPPHLDDLPVTSCFLSYWYVVRARDSASPPNRDSNTNRVQVDLLCPPAVPPAGIGNTLLAFRDVATQPVLDWAGFVPGADVAHYNVRRTLSKLGLPGGIVAQPVTTTFTDIAAAGPLYYYQVRTANACEVESSE